MDEQTRAALIPVIERIERLTEFARLNPDQVNTYCEIFGKGILHDFEVMLRDARRGKYSQLAPMVTGIEKRLYPMAAYRWN